MFDIEKINAPLYRAVKEYCAASPSRFHTPGHKAAIRSPLHGIFGPMLKLDVTELPETDSLFDAGGAIFDAETLAAREFGMGATLFSSGGATLCIQAMLRLASARGRRVICARNIHRSAVNAMAMLGLDPVFVWPGQFAGSGLPGVIRPSDIEDAAVKNPGACAVFLTSPDYYGTISDIKTIAEICRRHGLLLLVDNAHGAHFLAVRRFHPIVLGADMCCDSAHKTLPVLTGGAYLQIRRGSFSYRDAKDAMALFGSTSPSYPVMLSLDIARAWISAEGSAAFDSTINEVEKLRRLCASIGCFTPPEAVFDPARMTIDTASVGINGDSAAKLLRTNGIFCEMWDSRHVVLLPSPFNSRQDFAKLRKAIRALPVSAPLRLERHNFEPPRREIPLRDAVCAPSEAVSVSCSAGRIAAEAKCPCPPGVPVVIPGEKITPDAANALKNYGVFMIKVVK